MSDSPELLKPDAGVKKVTEVTDEELQRGLGNLEVENEGLQTEYAALLESSTAVTNKLREEVRELRSQLKAEKKSGEEREEELEHLRSELSDLKQKSAAASIDLPEAADLLNQLKGRRKKSKAELADVAAILEMLA